MSIQDFGAPPTIQIPSDAPGDPTAPQPSPAGGDLPSDPVEAAQDIVDRILNYMQIERDHQDKASAAGGLKIFQALLAANQQQQDQQVGGQLNPRALRKAGTI